MLKKFYTILLILFLVFSCRKGDELEVIEDVKQEEVQVERDSDEQEVESKPLIVLGIENTVRILVRADGAPGMWLGEDGEVYGFYVELDTLVFKEMGQSVEFVPYSDVGVAAQELKTGTSHVALAVSDLPDYRSFLNLSDPYETLNYIAFVHNDNSDIGGESSEELLGSLKGKKVGVQVTGFAYQNLRDYKELELIDYSTTTKAMEGLHNKEVDAVFDNREIGVYYIDKNNWNLKPVGKNIFNHKNTSGFSKAVDPEIVERYNKALDTLLNNGSVDKLHKKYYGEAAPEYKK